MIVRNLYLITPSCEEQMFRRFSERTGQVKLLIKLFEGNINDWILGTDSVIFNFGEPVERWTITCLTSGAVDSQLNSVVDRLREQHGISVEIEPPASYNSAIAAREQAERNDTASANFTELENQVEAIEAERGRRMTALGRAFSNTASSSQPVASSDTYSELARSREASVTNSLEPAFRRFQQAFASFSQIPQSPTTPSISTTEQKTIPSQTEPKEILTRFDIMDIDDGKKDS